MTRSRAKKTPNQYTSIPFPLKALKIILKELHLYKSTGAGKGKGMKVGDDGALFAEDDGVSVLFGRTEDSADDCRMKSGMMMMILKAQIMVKENLTIYLVRYNQLGGMLRWLTSAWLDDGSGGGRGNDSQEDDDDLREDPVAQIDMIVGLLLAIASDQC
jgi:hypothetical protein